MQDRGSESCNHQSAVERPVTEFVHVNLDCRICRPCTFVFSAVVEKLGDPSEFPVGVGTNFNVLPPLETRRLEESPDRLPPETRKPAVVTQAVEPVLLTWGDRISQPLVKVAAKLVGLLSPRTAPVKSAYRVVARSEKSPVRSSSDGTLISPRRFPVFRVCPGSRQKRTSCS